MNVSFAEIIKYEETVLCQTSQALAIYDHLSRKVQTAALHFFGNPNVPTVLEQAAAQSGGIILKTMR